MTESEEEIPFSDTIFLPNYHFSWQPCRFEWTRE